MSPTYRNITSIRKELGGKIVEPGRTILSLAYYDEDEVGLLKVKVEPYFNPIIYSDIITKKGEIKIPEKDSLGNRVTKYAIHFYLEKGRVTLRYNNFKNDPPLHMYESCKWNVRCFERNIDKIIVDAQDSFILNIIIEKI